MAGKGNPKTGGRAPGAPNRITAQVRELTLEALEQLGGVDYLVGLARKNPPVFAGLLRRCIPQAVEAKVESNGSVLQVIDLSDVARDIGPSPRAAALNAETTGPREWVEPAAALIEPKMPASLERQQLPADEPTYCRSKEDVAVDEGEAFERLPADVKGLIEWDV